jgi:hypothetical protein
MSLTVINLALIKEGHREYMDRVNATGAALILAVTAEQKILLITDSPGAGGLF